MIRQSFTALSGAVLAAALLWPATSVGEDWPNFNGNAAAQKYSTADQITPQNVNKLAVAWSTRTGDVSQGGPGKLPKTAWQSTPLFANNTLYVSTPFYRIFAVEPDTGKVKWIYDAFPKKPSKFHGKNRGMSYWASANPVAGQPCQKMVYIGTVDGLLHGVDADTGKPCESFGDARDREHQPVEHDQCQIPVRAEPVSRRL